MKHDLSLFTDAFLDHPNDLVFIKGKTLVLNACFPGDNTADAFHWSLSGNDTTTTSPTTTWVFDEAGEYTVSVVATNRISTSNVVTRIIILIVRFFLMMTLSCGVLFSVTE